MKTQTFKAAFKTARVIREYRTTCKGHPVTVPVGATVNNNTALGNDDAYRFWADFRQTVGAKEYGLLHDLTHYGVNVPADHCEPYKL